MTIEKAQRKANVYNKLSVRNPKVSYIAIGTGNDCYVAQYYNDQFVGIAAY